MQKRIIRLATLITPPKDAPMLAILKEQVKPIKIKDRIMLLRQLYYLILYL